MVLGYEFPSTLCTRVYGVLKHDSSYDFYMAPGDGSYATQSTVLWIFHSVNLYMKTCGVCGVVCGVMCSCIKQISFLWLDIILLFSNIFYGSLPVTFFNSSHFFSSFSFFLKPWLQWPQSRDQQSTVLSIWSSY